MAQGPPSCDRCEPTGTPQHGCGIQGQYVYWTVLFHLEPEAVERGGVGAWGCGGVGTWGSQSYLPSPSPLPKCDFIRNLNGLGQVIVANPTITRPSTDSLEIMMIWDWVIG